MIIGIMVALLLAGLGYFWYRSRSGSMSAAAADVPSERQDYGGISFTTKTGTAETKAAESGATAYDPSDPMTAARRDESLIRAHKLEDIAAAKGMTVDQAYQDHLHQQIAASNIEQQTINKIYSAKKGFIPTTATQQYEAIVEAGPTTQIPPGYYWDYAQQKAVPLTF